MNLKTIGRLLAATALVIAAAPFASITAYAIDNTLMIRALYTKMEAQPFNKAALSVYYADSFVDNNRPMAPPEASDKQAIVGLVEALNTGMPDGKRTLTMVEPIGEDKVAVYFTFDGTQTGQFLNFAPSAKKIHFNGIDIFRIEGGQIAEQWHVEEVINLIGQLSAQ